MLLCPYYFVNPFIPNGMSHIYKMDESISNLMVVGKKTSILFQFKLSFCKQKVYNLMRRLI